MCFFLVTPHKASLRKVGGKLCLLPVWESCIWEEPTLGVSTPVRNWLTVTWHLTGAGLRQAVLSLSLCSPHSRPWGWALGSSIRWDGGQETQPPGAQQLRTPASSPAFPLSIGSCLLQAQGSYFQELLTTVSSQSRCGMITTGMSWDNCHVNCSLILSHPSSRVLGFLGLLLR